VCVLECSRLERRASEGRLTERGRQARGDAKSIKPGEFERGVPDCAIGAGSRLVPGAIRNDGPSTPRKTRRVQIGNGVSRSASTSRKRAMVDQTARGRAWTV